MRSIILSLLTQLLFLGNLVAQDISFKDTFKLKGNFAEFVKIGMNKYNDQNKRNSFYQLNVVRNPIHENADSIEYDMKLITNYSGMWLWGASAKFINVQNSVILEISQIVLLKNSSIFGGTKSFNEPINDMDKTVHNKIILETLFAEIKRIRRFWI